MRKLTIEIVAPESAFDDLDGEGCEIRAALSAFMDFVESRPPNGRYAIVGYGAVLGAAMIEESVK